MTVIALDRIKREALAASLRYTTMNDACPYPVGTDAWHAFKQFFEAEREEQIQLAAAADIRANLHTIKAATDWSAA